MYAARKDTMIDTETLKTRAGRHAAVREVAYLLTVTGVDCRAGVVTFWQVRDGVTLEWEPPIGD